MKKKINIPFMKTGRFQMAEEAKDITISGVSDKSKTNGGGKRNSTVKTYISTKENATEEVLPHYVRTSSGSCHDSCKYGIKPTYEDKKRRPALRRVSNQMPTEEHVQMDVAKQHGRKRLELIMRPPQKKHEITSEQKVKNQNYLPPEKIILLSDSLAASLDQKSSNLVSEMIEHSPYDRYEESSEGSVNIKCMISSSILESDGSHDHELTSILESYGFHEHELTMKSNLLFDEFRVEPNGTVVKNKIDSEEFVPVIQVQESSVASEGAKLLLSSSIQKGTTSSEFPVTNLMTTRSLEEPVGIKPIDVTNTEDSTRFAYHAIGNRTKKTSHLLLVDSNLKTEKGSSTSIPLKNHRSTAFGKSKLANLGGSTKRASQMKSNTLPYRRSIGTAIYDAYMDKKEGSSQKEGQVERFSMGNNVKREMSKLKNAEMKISDVTRLKILKNKEVGKAVKSTKTETEQKKPPAAKKTTTIVNCTVVQKKSLLIPKTIDASAKPTNSLNIRKLMLKPSFPSTSVGGLTGQRLQTMMSNVTEKLHGDEDISEVISTAPTSPHLNRISSLKLKGTENTNSEFPMDNQTKSEKLGLQETAFCVGEPIPEKVDIAELCQDTFESPTTEEEGGNSPSKFTEMKECLLAKGEHQRNSSNLSESEFKGLQASESNESIDTQSVDQHPKPQNLNFSIDNVVNLQPGNNNPVKLRFKQTKMAKDYSSASTVNSGNMIDRCDKALKNYVFGAPTVVLRHQDVKNKKETQGLFNQVIEETASKLVETQKSKVKALVGAFETVISLQENKATY